MWCADEEIDFKVHVPSSNGRGGMVLDIQQGDRDALGDGGEHVVVVLAKDLPGFGVTAAATTTTAAKDVPVDPGLEYHICRRAVPGTHTAPEYTARSRLDGTWRGEHRVLRLFDGALYVCASPKNGLES